jgi:hypothetical protein
MVSFLLIEVKNGLPQLEEWIHRSKYVNPVDVFVFVFPREEKDRNKRGANDIAQSSFR